MTNVKFAPKDNGSSRIIHLYSDGGCRSTAQKGETIKDTDKCAYAFFLKQGGNEKLDGWAGYGKTNNAMEIAGLLNGLKAIKNKNAPVIAYLDSAYVVNTIEKKWYENWERQGWTKKGGLKNAELWKELITLMRQFPFFSIEKVKGHSDDEYNNLVDEHLNTLMNELPDVPPVNVENKENTKKSMLEEAMEQNVLPQKENKLFTKEEKSSLPPIIKISAQRAFSNQQVAIMLPEVLEKMTLIDLTEDLSKELQKYINIEESSFGDNKVFRTTINIVNEEATPVFKPDKIAQAKTLLNVLSKDPELNASHINMIKEIERILS